METTSKLSTVLILFILLSIITGCTSIAYKAGLKDCAPVYGSWCGENYPNNGANPYPVDDWDNACRAHDKCYDSGQSKQSCDADFIYRLEFLSYNQLAPQDMYNAYDYFKKDGYVSGWFNLAGEFSDALKECDGSDGKPSMFLCQTQMGACPLNPNSGPGRAGMACNCSGYLGVIIEQ